MTTPLFKKKNVRGTRRKRETSELEDNEGTSIYSAKKENEDQSLNASKWARYASLQKDEAHKLNLENGIGIDDANAIENDSSSNLNATNVVQSQIHELEIEDEEDMPQVAFSNEAMGNEMHQNLKSTNQAYTTVAMDNLELLVKSKKSDSSNTFTLKQSYFRDTPMETINQEKEYADKFGNVSDDDTPPVKVDAAHSDDDMEIINDFAGPKLAKNNDFYDMEVSVDEGSLDIENYKTSSIESLKSDIMQRIERLEISIKLRTERLPQVEGLLAEANEKRTKILKKLEAL